MQIEKTLAFFTWNWIFSEIWLHAVRYNNFIIVMDVKLCRHFCLELCAKVSSKICSSSQLQWSLEKYQFLFMQPKKSYLTTLPNQQLSLSHLGLISATFYVQLFCLQIPEAQKIQLSYQCLFTILGSMSVKAVRRIVMKLNPYH